MNSRKFGFVDAACTLYVILRCGVSGGKPMHPRIRPFEDRDAEAVVDLSLRAWAPVFASVEQVLGSEIFGRLHPDWREDQRRAVEDVCAAQKGRVRVMIPSAAWVRSPCWLLSLTTRALASEPP